MRRTIAIGSTLLVAACATTPPHIAPPTVSPPILSASGLERVLGHDAKSLIALFGEPALDVREDQARKLQFAGPICVLDAYLYPKQGQEPVATYLDARQPDGRDIDRASCIAALIANRKR